MHDTADFGTIVAEYRIPAALGERRARADFVLVLTVRDGRVVHWREYQDAGAMARALV